ncbi:response regulator [Fodinicurvata fenggangensis]|uniref:response regulator n=1 Tax=Fodinicurvata fenggangensis TaxID=1121830 RepID=UPI00068E36AB|nr:response regulator transcription factor [Fodinicurvata fenggangensis]
MSVLVVDDHPLVTKALVHLLEAEQIDAASVTEVAEAVDYIKTVRKPDLVILDAHMPKVNGLTGIGILQSNFPSIAIALWSGDERQEIIQQAIEKGALGFLSKAMSIRAIIPAIHLMLAGEPYLPVHLMTRKNEDWNRSETAQSYHLTPRERAVLDELANGLSNKEIARNLGIEEITVKLHLRAIYKKLSVKSRTQAISIYCNSHPASTPQHSST